MRGKPRWRIAAAACGALLTVAAPAAPTATAAAYPQPLSSEWWFTAWEIQTKVWPSSQGDGVTIALLDTGVQAGLPEFSGVILPGTDVAGAGDGRTDEDTSPVPGHGTGMASLINAQGTGTGFLGVAPKAKILPVVVRTPDSIVRGIGYAVDHGAQVISISEGGAAPCPAPVQKAVARAIRHDVVVVASSGNSGDGANASEYPGNCAGVLTVGAVGVSGQRFVPWEKTQRQPYVAVGAPGVGVGGVLRDGEVHTSTGGTSPATALTSATVALVRSKYPKMSARDVVQRVIASCRDVSPAGKDDRTGYGLVRPLHALHDKVAEDSPNPVFAAYDRWRAGNGGGAAGESGKPVATPGGKQSVPDVVVPAAIGLAVLTGAFLIIRRLRRPATAHRGYPPAAPPAGPPHEPPVWPPGEYGPRR